MAGFAPLQAQLAALDTSPLLQGEAIAQRRQEATYQQQYQAADLQRKTDAAAAAQAHSDGFKADFQRVLDNPNPAGWNYLRANYPDQLQSIDAGWKSYDDKQRQGMTETAATIYSSLKNDSPNLALAAMDRRIDSLKRQGVDTAESQTIRDMIASGDPAQIKRARGLSAMVLATASGDKFDSVWASINRDDRESELQPERVRAANALADYRETRAEYADDQQAADIAAKRARAENTRSMVEDRRRRAARAESKANGVGAKLPGRPVTPQSRRSPEAVGPDGKTYVVRGGKWVLK